MRLVKAHWLVCAAALLAFAPSIAHAGGGGKKDKGKEHTKTEEPTVPVVETPVIVEEPPVIVEEIPVVTETVVTETVVTETVVAPILLLTCAEVGAILIADNTAEVTLGHTALLRAVHPLVRNYALRVVTDHSVLSATVMARLSANGVVPLENDISARVTASGTEDLALLTLAPPLTFDLAYMQQQVIGHQRTLDLIDGVLLPAAADPASRDLLISARIMIAEHLALAVSISAVLL